MDLQLFPDGSEHSFGCFHSFRFFDLSSYFLYTSADMSTLEHPRFSTLIQDQRDILFSHSTDISGLLGNPLLGWAFWKAVHAEHEKREKIGLEVVAWKTVVQNMQYMKLLHHGTVGFHGQVRDGFLLGSDPIDSLKAVISNSQICSLDTLIQVAVQLGHKTLYINLHSPAVCGIKNPKDLAEILDAARKNGVTIFFLIENDALPKNLTFTLDMVKMLQDAGVFADFLYDPVHHLRELNELSTVSPAAWSAVVNTIQKYRPQVMHHPFGTLWYDSYQMEKIDDAMWSDYGAEVRRQQIFSTVEFQISLEKQLSYNPNNDAQIWDTARVAAAILHRYILPD